MASSGLLISCEITEASQEQTSGIEQVNQAIMLMDQDTQQNAALVEQAAKASGAMQDQVANLERVVGVFKLDAAHSRATIIAPAPRATQLGAAAKDKPKSALDSKRTPVKSSLEPRQPAPLAHASGEDWEEF